MAETTNISIRMEKDLKEQAENLFSELGLNMSTAFNIFVRQAVRQGKIPFELSVNMPNATTLASMQEIEDMINGVIPSTTQSVSSFVQEMGE